MFRRLHLSDSTKHSKAALEPPPQQLDGPPRDPHSLEVVRDGQPLFDAPVTRKRPLGRRVLWRKGRSIYKLGQCL